MAGHIVTFKMDEKLKQAVRREAERLLDSGMSVEEAAIAIADNSRCSYSLAKNQVEYVKVYKWSYYSKKLKHQPESNRV